MAKAHETTSPAPNPVRLPTQEERGQLAEWLRSTGHDVETAASLAETASVAVFDHYITDGPGYAGKVLSVVWGGAPSFFDVFTWEKGRMVRSGRDYDDKECDRCGAKNGTLCFNCWNSERPGINPTATAEPPANGQYFLAPGTDTAGTHLFDEVQLPPADVVRRFGPGEEGDGYKVSRRWVFRKGDLVFTLYDWKATYLYDVELWTPEQLWESPWPWDLHVGSKSPATKADVDEFVAYLRRETTV